MNHILEIFYILSGYSTMKTRIDITQYILKTFSFEFWNSRRNVTGSLRAGSYMIHLEFFTIPWTKVCLINTFL